MFVIYVNSNHTFSYIYARRELYTIYEFELYGKKNKTSVVSIQITCRLFGTLFTWRVFQINLDKSWCTVCHSEHIHRPLFVPSKKVILKIQCPTCHRGAPRSAFGIWTKFSSCPVSWPWTNFHQGHKVPMLAEYMMLLPLLSENLRTV